jgi:diguanylate cyclase (GGDEF)-like protein
MSHASAEAAKNTRSAVESMRKVLPIDKGNSSKRFAKKALEEENKLLQAKLHTKEKEVEFHNDIIQTLSSATDIKKSLNSIMEKTRKMVRAKACSLIFNDEPLFEILPLRSSKKINRFKFNKRVGIAGWVIERGVPVIVPDVLKDKRYNKIADAFSNLKIRSLMYAPLKIRNRVIGVLRLINKNQGNHFTDDDMNLLVNSANYIATAVERVFLYEKLKNDELTNLFNARHLNHAIEMEIERALRYNALFSLIFMDMDNFKKINDRFGHLVGSRTLIEIAQLLQKNLRLVDIISRYGGDEFVIILPQTPRESSFMVAERLRKVIEKNVFLKQEDYSIRLTASFGVASFPDDAGNKEELLDIADKAMFRGKFSTKNIVFEAK